MVVVVLLLLLLLLLLLVVSAFMTRCQWSAEDRKDLTRWAAKMKEVHYGV